MGDMGDIFRDMTEYKKQKRASNTKNSTAILKLNNIEFESKNFGAHLIVKGEKELIDYWPSTGKFITRSGKKGRGVKRLLKLCKSA